MDYEGQARAPYVVPRYRADAEPAWYHVLHGTVPGHQIDFIYCPEVPQGALTQTHLAHVARIIKYIEPREQSHFAFAIGNLSRDDVQYDPGHGGLALIFGLRVEGVVDHASRAMPPYAHGLLAVDRSLDYGILLDAIFTFYRRFFQEGPTDAAGSFYRSYVHTMETEPHAIETFLRQYTDGFSDLPRSRRSQLGCDFFAPEDAKLHRITIVHENSEPFDSVAAVAATLGSVLYRSNIKWTSISNGREVDIPGGVSVRFVPESDAPRDPKGPVFRLNELPKSEAEMAERLFGAKPKAAEAAPRMGWREQAAARKGGVAPDGIRAKQATLPPNTTMAMLGGHGVGEGPGHAAGAPVPGVGLGPGAGPVPGAGPGPSPALKQSSPRLREVAGTAHVASGVAPPNVPASDLSAGGVAPPPHGGLPAPSQVGVVAPSNVGVPVPPQVGVLAPSNVGVPAPPHVGVVAPSNAGVPAPPHVGVVAPSNAGVPAPPHVGAPKGAVEDLAGPRRVATEPMPERLGVVEAPPPQGGATGVFAPAVASPEVEVDVDDAAPTLSAALELEPSVVAGVSDVAPTLNAGLEPEEVAPTLLERPAPRPAISLSSPEQRSGGVDETAPGRKDPIATGAKSSLVASPVKGASASGGVGGSPGAVKPLPAGEGPAGAADAAQGQSPVSPVAGLRSSVPDDVASLDALPPIKPGKGRWFAIGGVAVAVVAAIVVLGSQSGSDGSGRAAGTGSSSAQTPPIPGGPTETQASQPAARTVDPATPGTANVSTPSSASARASGPPTSPAAPTATEVRTASTPATTSSATRTTTGPVGAVVSTGGTPVGTTAPTVPPKPKGKGKEKPRVTEDDNL